jgi:drug/metabolite transporter (DMT)-like permease
MRVLTAPPLWLALTVLFVSSCFWGLTWWPLKQIAALGLSGLPLILVAYGGVGLLLTPVLWATRAAWRPHWRKLLLVFACGGVANLAFPYSMIHGEVIRSMALFYLLPVWGVLGGRLFLGERIGRWRLLAVTLALSGALLLLGGPALLAAPPSFIDLIAILSGFAFAMTNLSFRATPELPVPSKLAALFLACFLFAGGFVLLDGVPFPAVAPATLGWALLFGVGMILVITSATQWAVTHMEAGKSSIVMVMELVSAVISAAFIAGDTMSPLEMAGGALILSATVLEALAPPSPPAART